MAGARNAKIVFMPFEASGLLSSIGAIRQVFAEQPGDELSNEPEPISLPPQADTDRVPVRRTSTKPLG